MHALFAITAGPSVHRGLLASLLGAGICLGGCAPERLYGIGRPHSECRADSVLYCEVDAHADIERCQCVWRGGAGRLLNRL